MSNVKPCGFCSLLGDLMRRALCMGSRRGSSESYYRELGDQDTLKIDGSQTSEDSAEIHHDSEVRQDDSADGRDQASTSNARHPRHRLVRSRSQGSLDNSLVEAQICLSTDGEAPAAEDDADINIGCLHLARGRPMGRFLSMHRRRRRPLVTRSLQRDEALLDDLLNGQVQCVLNQCALWDFNAFTLDSVAGGRCLPVLCVHLFHVYGLMSFFRLDPVKVWKLFTLIEQNYHATNPYHNSIHAADVTQAMHCFLQQTQILEYMQPLEVMAGLLAAMAHDLDHPGVNQTFLVATSNHLVALYQSISVLENHHWRSAISCLIESNIFEDMPEYQIQLQEKIRSLILATDITRQQDYLGQFKIYLDTNTLDLRLVEHRHLVLQIALKCADISNPCRPWDISQMWSLKVCEEFFRQGDLERCLNLPLTPLCDRNSTTVPSIQSGFFKYVVTPLITEWHRFLQSDLSEQMLRNLVANHQKWDSFAKENEEGDEAAEDGDDDRELSGSSELLLPRRRSLNPAPAVPAGFREQLRRFSMPLNLRQRNREQPMQDVAGALLPEAGPFSPAASEPSFQDERGPSSEYLVPESSIASITTQQQAQRINNAFHDPNWRLVRQPMLPPLEAMSRAHSLIPRASSHDFVYPRAVQSDGGIQIEANGGPTQDEALDQDIHRVGNQLRENLSNIPLDLGRRRKSMPARAEPSSGRDRRFRDVLPQLIARSLSPRTAARRGSAPAHVTDDRPPRAPRFPAVPFPRRSSLPVEVITGISSY